MYQSDDTRPIVLGTDGSTAALTATRWAAREARYRDAPLRIVHVIAPVHHRELVYGAPDVDGDYARDVLRAAVDSAAATEPDTMTAASAIRGRPAETMAGQSQIARLVVLGSTGENALAVLFLGSTVLSVVESAECPIAVVRQFDPDRSGPVIVGLSGTDSSSIDRVVAEAFQSASSRGSHVVGVYANATARKVFHPVGSIGSSSASRTVVDAALARFTDEFPWVRTSSVHREDGAAAELIALSRDAELLVVGHRQGSPCGATLITVLRESHCPVLIVPHP